MNVKDLRLFVMRQFIQLAINYDEKFFNENKRET